MKVELKSSSPKHYCLELRIEDPCIPFLSGLRRIIMSEVPTFAIHDIVEHENTGAIRSERLIHTLGLIPIVVPGVDLLEAERRYRLGDKNTKKSIALRFRLFDACNGQKEFSHRSTFKRTTSKNLVWMPRTTEQSFLPEDQRPRPVHTTFPITNLKAGQRISIDAICIPGTGLLNAKWSPACPCYFRYETPAPRALARSAETLKKIARESACEYVEKCANGAPTEPWTEERQEDEIEEVEDEYENDEENLGPSIFTIETTQSVTPEEALSYGLRIFEDKIDALLSAFRSC